jgi:hypothetical protein
MLLKMADRFVQTHGLTVYPPCACLLASFLAFVRDEQIHIVYLGNLPMSGPSSKSEGFSLVEAAHHDLLDQVLDEDRSRLFLLRER